MWVGPAQSFCEACSKVFKNEQKQERTETRKNKNKKEQKQNNRNKTTETKANQNKNKNNRQTNNKPCCCQPPHSTFHCKHIFKHSRRQLTPQNHCQSMHPRPNSPTCPVKLGAILPVLSKVESPNLCRLERSIADFDHPTCKPIPLDRDIERLIEKLIEKLLVVWVVKVNT